LRVLSYSIAGGLLLMLFAQIQDIIRYVFSLGAFFLGIHFFKRYESKGMRIAFIVLGVIWYFLFNLIYVFLAYINGWETIAGRQTP